jgi:hypothetical protein
MSAVGRFFKAFGAFGAFGAALLGLVACSDPPTPPAVGPPEWHVVLDEGDLDRAVLSVWGTGPDEVFVVGGPLGNTGRSSLALRFDGSAWHDLKATGEETFWWVSGSGSKDVWMVGEKGRIAHWDGASWEEHASGVTSTLWGVYAFSPTDAWAVGGTPEGGVGPQNDVVLRWDGSAWKPEALPGEPLGRSLYKVWGTSSENLYVVGEYGTIWHRTAVGWALESDPPLATWTLFTVFGCSASEVYAVGGKDILQSNGQSGSDAWTRLDVTIFNGVNGVSCGAPGEVAIVGNSGLKRRLVDGSWVDEFAVEPFGDMHAVWADGAGAFWAVGGDFYSKPAPGTPRKGLVARFGQGQVASSIGP